MIRGECRADNLDISEMVFERFSRLLPERDATPEQSTILQTLFAQPMLLSNAELGQVIRLAASDRKHYLRDGRSPQQHSFYIRSWIFTPSQLYDLATSMKKDGLAFQELDEWEFISFMSGPRNLTVRYIGTTKGHRNPFRRFSDDLACRPKGSLLGAFQDYVERIYPQVFHNAEIHVVLDASLEIFGKGHHLGNQLNADDTESLLIHLLGYHSLLNLQLGRHHIRYLPDGGDEIAFRELRTRYFEEFLSESSTFHLDKDWSDLTSNFAAVLTGREERDERTSEAVRNVLQNQAKPYQYFGTTVMVFVGEELTDAHFKAGCSFWAGPSKTSRLVRNLMHRIKNVEKGNVSGDYAGPCHDLSRAFTFLNIVPLPKYIENTNSREFIKTYFECTRPMIVVTFGQKAAVAISKLTAIKYRSGYTTASFTLGECHLATRSYGHHEEDLFIHIPLNHPGRYQYGSRLPAELRFFYVSMHFTFFIAACTTEIIKRCSGSPLTIRRGDLCVQVLAYVDQRLHAGAGLRFLSNMEQTMKASLDNQKSKLTCSTGIFSNFDRAIRAWFESQGERTRQYYVAPEVQKSRKTVVAPPESFIRLFAVLGKQNSIAIFDNENKRRILSVGVAVGQARSSERQRDLDRLWDQPKRELHLIVPHSEDQRETWMEQFMSLQPGQSYFLRVLSQLADCDYLPALLGTEQPSWLPIEPSTKDVLCDAVIKCGLWVQKRKPKSSVTMYPSPFITAGEMQGHPVGIKDDGVFQIRWKCPKGVDNCLLLSARFAVPRSSRESRALSFTEHGLDVVDASGNPLRPSSTWNGEAPRASISKISFLATSPGQLLIDLWRAVRQANGFSVDNPDRERGKKWGQETGQRMASSHATKEFPPQNRPPSENDANFLLVKFLDERFPDGGIFRTAPKEKVPDSTEDLQAFVEFCRRPDYINHPYSSIWLGMLERATPRIATLGKKHSDLPRLQNGKIQWLAASSVENGGRGQISHWPEKKDGILMSVFYSTRR